MKVLSRMTLFAAGLSVAALPAVYAADESSTSTEPTYENVPAHPSAHGKHHGDRAKHPGRTGRQRAERKMMAELGLSDDQKAEIKAIHQKYRPELQALRDDESLAPEARREKAREIMQAQQNEIRSALTPEQAKKWDKRLTKAAKQRRGGPGQRPDGKKRGKRPGPPRGGSADQ